MNNTIKASLLIPYRQREAHLKTQLHWWLSGQNQELIRFFELLLIDVSETPSESVQQTLQGTPIQYLHCESQGIFHKTRALNLGLKRARGEFVVPYDVDLIPVHDTLQHHLWMAERSPDLLITGYRLMFSQVSLDVNQIDAALEQATVAPEDQPTALWKHLVRHEKFGVLPFFQRDQLLNLGGWDEQFVGWGGEDQDMLERYLQAGYYLCRSPHLVYLHLFHPPGTNWAESHIVAQNRQHYYSRPIP